MLPSEVKEAMVTHLVVLMSPVVRIVRSAMRRSTASALFLLSTRRGGGWRLKADEGNLMNGMILTNRPLEPRDQRKTFSLLAHLVIQPPTS